MAIDERVRCVEAKVEEQSTAIAELRGLITALDRKMDRRFEAVDNRLWAVIALMITVLLGVATLIVKTA